MEIDKIAFYHLDRADLSEDDDKDFLDDARAQIKKYIDVFKSLPPPYVSLESSLKGWNSFSILHSAVSLVDNRCHLNCCITFENQLPSEIFLFEFTVEEKTYQEWIVLDKNLLPRPGDLFDLDAFIGHEKFELHSMTKEDLQEISTMFWIVDFIKWDYDPQDYCSARPVFHLVNELQPRTKKFNGENHGESNW